MRHKELINQQVIGVCAEVPNALVEGHRGTPVLFAELQDHLANSWFRGTWRSPPGRYYKATHPDVDWLEGKREILRNTILQVIERYDIP